MTLNYYYQRPYNGLCYYVQALIFIGIEKMDSLLLFSSSFFQQINHKKARKQYVCVCDVGSSALYSSWTSTEEDPRSKYSGKKTPALVRLFSMKFNVYIYICLMCAKNHRCLIFGTQSSTVRFHRWLYPPLPPPLCKITVQSLYQGKRGARNS